jgi:RNA polymerase-binding transcription factor DksA
MDEHRAEIVDATSTLDDVDRALERLSEGTYRTCETCGADLGDDLLAAAPTRRRCEDHVA